MDTDVPLAVDPALLPRDPEVLLPLVVQLMEELRKRDRRVAELEHHMDLLLKRLYGRTSERFDPAQLPLFDTTPEEPAAEPADPPSLPEPAADKPRKKGAHGRRRIPDNLKRVERIHDLTAAEKGALGGEENLVLIGQQITEQVEWQPSSLFAIRHVQLTYTRRDRMGPSESSNGSLQPENIITASKPPQVIPGGLPGPGLVAHVATSKYVDHVPLNRQDRQFGRHGMNFSRQTTCDWAMGGADLLAPVYEFVVRLVLLSLVLHADATSVKIRDVRKKLKQTGYFWSYVGDAEHPLTAFTYTATHSRDGPAGFLASFRGHLQADAHGVYDGLYTAGRIVEVACWMHARRGFFEARMLNRAFAEPAIMHIQRLYAVERDIKEQLEGAWRELPPEERYGRIATVRQEQARPVLDELFPWLEAEVPKLLPKDPIRKAAEYVLRQQAALSRYCENGRLAIDNGAAERALRGIALGRRNWLFCGSERGARAACVYFTLGASCRRHDIDPFVYLRDLFTRLPILMAETNGRPADEQLRPLLPDQWRPEL